MIEFIIRRKPVSWNIFYAGQHWAIRSAMKNEGLQETMAALNEQKVPIMKAPIKVTIEIHHRTWKTIDVDNCASGKFIIDGLKRYFGFDDSPKNIPEVTYKSIYTPKIEDIIKVKIYDYNRIIKNRRRNREGK